MDTATLSEMSRAMQNQRLRREHAAQSALSHALDLPRFGSAHQR